MSENFPTIDLPDGVVLLDGAMGTELQRRGVQGPNTLWSTFALMQAEEIVTDIYSDYIEAGASIITTNTYATIRRRLRESGLVNRFEELNIKAGKLANRARSRSGQDNLLIAGSLPPLYGSHRPDLARPFEEIEPQYREQAEILAPYVDLFICETMSSGAEALAAASGATSAGKPVWVAWSLHDDASGRLRSGETITQAAAMLKDLPVSTYLANCCKPESISAAIPQLNALNDFPVGAYANGFTQIPDKWTFSDDVSLPDVRVDLSPDNYAQIAQ
ncbi:MAG: homocysteine S-methyltransferase family protein, partial [Gammaproteobacteria bacterium]|nr:homocysteine S-methyltransferase family protein [Gammaproteobacteria bacterium]